jgi:iron complex transport system permease protein
VTRRTPLWVLWGQLLIALTAAFAASLVVGPAGVGVPGLFGDLDARAGEAARLIFLELRLPRALLGALIGAALGASGAALQGLMRNPLADPGVIGVSSAASLGAVLAIYWGASLAAPLVLPIAAIGMAAVAAVLLLGLSTRGDVHTLILAGIALSSLAGALTALALNLSPSPYAAMEIVSWLLGSVSDRSMEHVWMAAPFVAAGGLCIALSARSLDALSLGEEAAVSLGVDLRRVSALVVTGAALMVGASAAVAGVIGFVGLVAPHVMRPLVQHRPSSLLPASALAGAILVLLADTLVRVIPTSAELRLGVATALIGAPLFVWLVLRSRGEGAG